MNKLKKGISLIFSFLIFTSLSLPIFSESIGDFEYVNDETGTYLKDNDNGSMGSNVLNYNYTNSSDPKLDEEGFINYNDIAYLKKYAIQDKDVNGKFLVNLDIKGNSLGTPLDLVFIIDYSTTMKGEKLENTIAGMNSFLDEIATSLEAGTIRVGIVTYNREITTLPYTSNEAEIINFLRTTSSHSGTFIQKGIYGALDLYTNYGNSTHKNLAIHIGDGSANRAFLPQVGATVYPNNGEILPLNGYSAVSYYTDFQNTSSQYYTNDQSVVEGDPTNAILASSEEISNLTLGTMVYLKQLGIIPYSVAVSPSKRGEYINRNIANDESHYFTIDENLVGLGSTLENVANTINTIQNGTVSDPLGEQIILTKNNGRFDNYTLKGHIKTNGVWIENSNLINNVSVTEANDVITVTGLNVGYNEKVTLTYEVHLITEQNFQPEHWYLTNGRTTLKPNVTDTLFDFPIPAIKGAGTTININKTWSDFDNLYGFRPQNITYYIERTNTTNPLAWTKSSEYSLTSDTNWTSNHNTINPENTTDTEYLPLYNNEGTDFEYNILEASNIDYSSTISKDENNFNLLNTLKTYNLTLTKIDNNNKRLENIEFDLSNTDNTYNNTQTTEKNGKITFENLVKGSYILHENTNLTGYQKLEDIHIVLDYDTEGDLVIITPTNWDMTIVNQKDTTLVSTGFNNYLELFAMSLLALSSFILFMQLKKRTF